MKYTTIKKWYLLRDICVGAYAIRLYTLIVFLLLVIMFLPDAKSQNSTSSPFSIFGIGEIESRSFGRTTGMGDVGIGYQSENFLNKHNPAALSGIDTLRFIIDVSAAVKISNFVTGSGNNQTTNFSFKSMAAGVRLTKKWTSSVGLSPFSNVGYTLKDQQHVEGTLDSYNDILFTGSGGINTFYWANAYELFRGFSLGITSSYIFGNITHIEETKIFSIKTTHNVSKINFDFGGQYKHQFGNHTSITVGGIYSNEAPHSIQRSKTISSYMQIERSERLPDLKSFFPQSYGGGFSILRNKKNAEWIFAADYKCQNWSADKASYDKMTYTDSHVYKAGIQFTPNTKRPDKYIHVMRFQLGACYNKSYLNVSGHQMEDYSLSAGLGFPFRNSSYVNITANVGESQIGKRGSERYILFSINLSLIDRWFAKYQWN